MGPNVGSSNSYPFDPGQHYLLQELGVALCVGSKGMWENEDITSLMTAPNTMMQTTYLVFFTINTREDRTSQCSLSAWLVAAVEYTDFISVKGWDPTPPCVILIFNHLRVRLQSWSSGECIPLLPLLSGSMGQIELTI